MIKRLVLSSLILCSALFAEESKVSLTLEQVYQKALQQSEKLKISEQDIKAAEAQYHQLVALLYPNISLVTQQQLRSDSDYGSLSGSSFDEPTGTVGGAQRRSLGYSQFENFISVRQPLFNGFRDYILSEAVQTQTKALSFDLERNKELLFLDAAELFHQIAMYQGDLAVLAASEKVLLTRIAELKDFMALGKSRESEVLSASSDLAEVRSSTEQLRGLLAASKELLAFLIGLPSGSWQLEVKTKEELLLPLESYLQRAAQRSDLHALKLRAQAASHYVKASERESWPALSLDASAYPHEDPERQRDWQIIFRLEVPVYEGGKYEAQTAEERAKMESARLAEQERIRQVERDVRVAYSNLLAAQKERLALAERRDLAKRNFSSQSADYKNGIVSNLDVLQAIRQLQEAERQLIDSEALVRLNRVRLEVQAGEALPLAFSNSGAPLSGAAQ